MKPSSFNPCGSEPISAMMTKMAPEASLVRLAILLGLVSASCAPADARIGESLGSFKAKCAQFYTQKNEKKKEDRTYIMYSLKPNASQPSGFGVGMTVTIVDGKVVGQSMAIRMGDNYELGKVQAIGHTIAFINETLGRPITTDPAAVQKEFSDLGQAVEQALAGSAQDIRYPGYTSRIRIARSGDGDLLLAATPDLGQDASKGKPSREPKEKKPDGKDKAKSKEPLSENETRGKAP